VPPRAATGALGAAWGDPVPTLFPGPEEP
jgi:hypothetical protein